MKAMAGMMPRSRERDVLRAIQSACAAYGLQVNRNNVGAMRNPAGRLVYFGRASDPDLRGIVSDRRSPHFGRALAIEVKRPGQRPTEGQISRLREINAAGGIAFWVDDPAACMAVLDRVIRDGCRVEVHQDGSQEVVDE